MKIFLARLIFAIHVIIVLFWWGLFFVPSKSWPGKINFHFYLTLFIVIQQIIWGLLISPWTKKYRLVCVLTTITQLLRGQSISDDSNYDHSSTKELLGKFGIQKVPHRVSAWIAFIVLMLVSIQYFTQ